VRSEHLDTRMLLLCVDDRQINKLVREGDLESILRLAVDSGFAPITAIQMATINTAEHYKIRDIGSVSPGKIADLVILEGELEEPKAKAVVVNGNLVAEGGVLLAVPGSYSYPSWTRRTVHLRRRLTAGDFAIYVKRMKEERTIRVRCIKVGLPKKEVVRNLARGKPGLPLESDIAQDVVHIAVVERHTASGRIGRAFVNGTGIKRGAIASSYCHDSHNIVVAGASREDMAICVNELARLGGGFVAALNGHILGCVELPIAGMLSDAPFNVLAEKFDLVENAIRKELECTLAPNPFYWLSIIPLPNIPELGLTDRGLFDARTFKIVNPIVQ